MAALGPALEGSRVLDLFAGSGALGLEALSRGAREVVFVERARSALVVLRGNVELLGAGASSSVVVADAMAYVRRLEQNAFDLTFADPPYDMGFAAKLLNHQAEVGFTQELWVEHRSSEVLPSITGIRQRKYGDTTLSILSRKS
jgi:16S rRNA (guanine966-N2)-methyltransferase